MFSGNSRRRKGDEPGWDTFSRNGRTSCPSLATFGSFSRLAPRDIPRYHLDWDWHPAQTALLKRTMRASTPNTRALLTSGRELRRGVLTTQERLILQLSRHDLHQERSFAEATELPPLSQWLGPGAGDTDGPGIEEREAAARVLPPVQSPNQNQRSAQTLDGGDAFFEERGEAVEEEEEEEGREGEEGEEDDRYDVAYVDDTAGFGNGAPLGNRADDRAGPHARSHTSRQRGTMFGSFEGHPLARVLDETAGLLKQSSSEPLLHRRRRRPRPGQGGRGIPPVAPASYSHTTSHTDPSGPIPGHAQQTREQSQSQTVLESHSHSHPHSKSKSKSHLHSKSHSHSHKHTKTTPHYMRGTEDSERHEHGKHRAQYGVGHAQTGGMHFANSSVGANYHDTGNHDTEVQLDALGVVRTGRPGPEPAAAAAVFADADSDAARLEQQLDALGVAAGQRGRKVKKKKKVRRRKKKKNRRRAANWNDGGAPLPLVAGAQTAPFPPPLSSSSFSGLNAPTVLEIRENRDHLLGWLQRELARRRVGSSRLMGLMDDNRSGHASYNEFANGLMAVDIDLTREQCMRLFKAVDVGGDFSVSLQELDQRLYTVRYRAPTPTRMVHPASDTVSSMDGRGVGGGGGDGGGRTRQRRRRQPQQQSGARVYPPCGPSSAANLRRRVDDRLMQQGALLCLMEQEEVAEEARLARLVAARNGRERETLARRFEREREHSQACILESITNYTTESPAGGSGWRDGIGESVGGWSIGPDGGGVSPPPQPSRRRESILEALSPTLLGAASLSGDTGVGAPLGVGRGMGRGGGGGTHARLAPLGTSPIRPTKQPQRQGGRRNGGGDSGGEEEEEEEEGAFRKALRLVFRIVDVIGSGSVGVRELQRALHGGSVKIAQVLVDASVEAGGDRSILALQNNSVALTLQSAGSVGGVAPDFVCQDAFVDIGMHTLDALPSDAGRANRMETRMLEQERRAAKKSEVEAADAAAETNRVAAEDAAEAACLAALEAVLPAALAPTVVRRDDIGEVFAMLDRDNSGHVDKVELASAIRSDALVRDLLQMSEHLHVFLRPRAFAAAFQKVDVNRDGKVSLDEFRAFADSASTDAADDVGEVFAMIDKDGSGHVDKTEITNAIRHDVNVRDLLRTSDNLRVFLRPRAFAAAFQTVDLDRNGKVSLVEFRAFADGVIKAAPIRKSDDIGEVFAMIDTDCSGHVDKKEIMRAVQANHQVRDLLRAVPSLQGLLRPRAFAAALRSLDTDSDGNVSLAEFRTLASNFKYLARVSGSGPSSGALASEARQQEGAMYSADDIGEVFAMLDKDGEGQVDIEEVLRLCREDDHVRDLLRVSDALNVLLRPRAFASTFRSLDADHNGRVSLTEFRAFAQTVILSEIGEADIQGDVHAAGGKVVVATAFAAAQAAQTGGLIGSLSPTRSRRSLKVRSPSPTSSPGSPASVSSGEDSDDCADEEREKIQQLRAMRSPARRGMKRESIMQDATLDVVLNAVYFALFGPQPPDPPDADLFECTSGLTFANAAQGFLSMQKHKAVEQMLSRNELTRWIFGEPRFFADLKTRTALLAQQYTKLRLTPGLFLTVVKSSIQQVVLVRSFAALSERASSNMDSHGVGRKSNSCYKEYATTRNLRGLLRSDKFRRLPRIQYTSEREFVYKCDVIITEMTLQSAFLRAGAATKRRAAFFKAGSTTVGEVLNEESAEARSAKLLSGMWLASQMKFGQPLGEELAGRIDLWPLLNPFNQERIKGQLAGVTDKGTGSLFVGEWVANCVNLKRSLIPTKARRQVLILDASSSRRLSVELQNKMRSHTMAGQGGKPVAGGEDKVGGSMVLPRGGRTGKRASMTHVEIGKLEGFMRGFGDDDAPGSSSPDSMKKARKKTVILPGETIILPPTKMSSKGGGGKTQTAEFLNQYDQHEHRPARMDSCSPDRVSPTPLSGGSPGSVGSPGSGGVSPLMSPALEPEFATNPSFVPMELPPPRPKTPPQEQWAAMYYTDSPYCGNPERATIARRRLSREVWKDVVSSVLARDADRNFYRLEGATVAIRAPPKAFTPIRHSAGEHLLLSRMRQQLDVAVQTEKNLENRRKSCLYAGTSARDLVAAGAGGDALDVAVWCRTKLLFSSAR